MLLQQQQQQQQQQQLLDRQGRRFRMINPCEALAHALLETVRQALDDNGGDAGDDVTTAAVHAPTPLRSNSHLSTRRTHRSRLSAPPREIYTSSSTFTTGFPDLPYPKPEPEPVAYFHVEDNARHEPIAKRRRQCPSPDISAKAAVRQSCFDAGGPALKVAWAGDPASAAAAGGIVDFHQLSDVEYESFTAAAAAAAAAIAAAAATAAGTGSLNPHPETPPSHGSAHTNVELFEDGREFGEARDDAPGGGDFGEYGTVDRTEQNSAGDGNEEALHRNNKKLVQAGSPKTGIPGGPCAHCGTTESPQWRRPLTKKVVLCNACGIYFSRHHSLPKRKKQLHAVNSSPAALRASKAAPAQAQAPAKPEALAYDILCDEKLETDEEEAAPPPAARATAASATAAAVAPFRTDAPGGPLPPSRRGLQGEASAPLGSSGSQAPAAQPSAEEEGPVPAALQRGAVPDRSVLSLPLMAPLPVLGGINAIVQTFLNTNTVTR